MNRYAWYKMINRYNVILDTTVSNINEHFNGKNVPNIRFHRFEKL